MSTLTIDTAELRKLSFFRKLCFRVVSWIRKEYRSTSYAHIRWKAENGDPQAQFALAALCDTGNAGFHSPSEALRWYQKAAFQGVAEAQLALGLRHLSGQGTPQNDAEAVLWLRKAAEQGLAEAQFQLATLYKEGRGTAKDLLQASKWFRKAADRGHAPAKQNFKELNSLD